MGLSKNGKVFPGTTAIIPKPKLFNWGLKNLSLIIKYTNMKIFGNSSLDNNN